MNVIKVFLILILTGSLGAFFYFKFKPKVQNYIGPQIENFALIDQSGRVNELYKMTNKKLIAFYSFGLGCPIVRKNLSKVKQLSDKYSSDLNFYFLDSNLQDTREKLIREFEEYNLTAPILIDDTQEVARSLNINRTGEVLLVEPNTWKIIYRGPINDQFNYAADSGKAKNEYLEQTINSYLNNEEIVQNKIDSLGCAITVFELPKANYYAEVDKIFEKKCWTCHEKIEPKMSFSYDDARAWSKMIKEVIKTERMPPWEVDDYYTKIKNDFRLSKEEKNIIYGWIANNFPMGDETKKAKFLKGNKGTTAVANADITLPMAKEFVIVSTEKKRFYYELLMQNGPKDLFITEVNFNLSNPAPFHGASLIISKNRLPASSTDFDQRGIPIKDEFNFNILKTFDLKGYSNKFAYRIPQNAYVYLWLHFRLSAKEEQIFVTTYLTKYKGKEKPVEIKVKVVGKKFNVPANKEFFKFTNTIKIPKDTQFYALMPHLHARGSYFNLKKRIPGGTIKTLYASRVLQKSDILFELDGPIFVEKGSELINEFEYNNSVTNEANIDFNKEIPYGPDFYENEMGAVYAIYNEIN